MKREKWNIEDFKKYITKCVKEHYWITPSAIVLRSFYVADVEKEPGVTLRMFDYLRGIAEKELKDYKSINKKNNIFAK